MLFLDYLFIALLIFSVWRGGRRGFVRELKGLISAILFIGLLSGVWLFAALRKFFGSLGEQYHLTAGAIGFVLSFLAAWWLLNWFKHRLPERLGEGMTESRVIILGGLLGFLRVFLVMSFILIATITAPVAVIRDTATSLSFIGLFLSEHFHLQSDNTEADTSEVETKKNTIIDSTDNDEEHGIF